MTKAQKDAGGQDNGRGDVVDAEGYILDADGKRTGREGHEVRETVNTGVRVDGRPERRVPTGAEYQKQLDAAAEKKAKLQAVTPATRKPLSAGQIAAGGRYTAEGVVVDGLGRQLDPDGKFSDPNTRI